jgi:hypothetical protein
LKIVNSSGKIMIDNRAEGSATIDMEGYSPGFYLILVQTENDFFFEESNKAVSNNKKDKFVTVSIHKLKVT